MSKSLNVNIEINLNSLVFSLVQLEQDDLIQVFKQVDLQIAEVDFTENLLVTLVKSLKGDLTEVEKANVIHKLEKAIKG